jgi:hypothetical protein
MLRAQYPAHDFEGLAVEILSLCELAPRAVHVSQIAHRIQRVGMLGAQDAPHDL